MFTALVHGVSAMRKWYRNRHRWPRRSESVIDYERDDRGPYGHGTVIHVDKDNQRVLVRFFSPPESHNPRWVLYYNRMWSNVSDTHWQQGPLWDFSTPHYVDLNAQFEAASCDQLLSTQNYEFDDLRWSSHVGGVGAWITTRRYNP